MSVERRLEDALRFYEVDRPGETPRSPFKFLDPYVRGDRESFFGRNAETEDLKSRYYRSRVLIVYGESGAGKTSLIQCGLRNAVPDEDAEFWSVRCHVDPLAHLRRTLGDGGHAASVEELVEARAAATSKTLVLVFDQFEELFIFQPEPVRRMLAEELARLLDKRLDAKMLFCIREEYFARMSELEPYLSGLFDNRYWLSRMGKHEAHAAIVEPCARSGVQVDEELPVALLSRLEDARGDIDLPYLQLLLDRLYRKAEDRGKPLRMLREDLEDVGGLEDALSNHLEERLAALADPELGRDVLKLFVSGDRTRRSNDASAVVAAYPGQRQASIEKLLHELVAGRVLRESDPQHYELRHDRLAEAIGCWLTPLDDERLELEALVEGRLAEHRASGTLIESSALLNRIEAHVRHLRLDQEAVDFVRRSRTELERSARRKSRIRIAVVAGTSALIAAVASIAFVQWWQSKQALEAAEGEAQSLQEQAAKARRPERWVGRMSPEERGRQELLDARHVRALALLAEAYRLEPSSPSLRFLLGSATAQLPVKVIVPPGEELVEFASFSADGTRVFTAAHNGRVRIWDVESASQLSTFELKWQDQGHGAWFNRDFTRAGVLGSDGTVRIVDLESGERLATLAEHSGWVMAMSFSADGRRIVTGGMDETARIWDAQTWEELAILSGHDGTVGEASFSLDGTRVVTCGGDHTACIWDTQTGERFATLRVQSLRYAALNADGTRVVTTSLDGTARIWDANTAEVLTTLHSYSGSYYAAFSPDGTRVLTSGGGASIWDTTSGEKLAHFPAQGGWVSAASFNRDGTRVVTVNPGTQLRDSAVRIWDTAAGTSMAVLRGHDGPLESASFSPDGTRIVTASSDKTARIWDTESTVLLTTLAGHAGGLVDASFSPDGTRIVTASSDKTARIWDASEATPLMTLTGHADGLSSAAFDPDGSRIVTGSHDKTARIWDAGDGTLRVLLEGHEGPVTSASLSTDGARIVTASQDRTVRIWDASDGSALGTLSGHAGAVRSVSFNPDGSRVVTASDDGTVRIWEVDGAKELAKLETQHSGPFWSAFYTSDGARIVAVTRKRTVCVWDARTTALLMRNWWHGARIITASLSSDGSRLVTASHDRTARILNVALETRSPQEIDDLVRLVSPWEFVAGRLVLRTQ